MIKNFIKIIGVYTLTAIMLTGCGLETHQSGDLPTQTRLNTLKIGQNRDAVVRILGMPAYQAPLMADNEAGYVYVYAKIRKLSRAFLPPKETDREIYVISFNKENIVTNIRHLDQSNQIAIAYDETETKSGGRELSTLEQIAKNFGRYDAGGRDSTTR